VLHDLIVQEVLTVRDQELWDAAEQRQEDERSALISVSDNWSEIVAQGLAG